MLDLKLARVVLSGYRGFSEEATLDMAAMTLVYGENSAGKSSLIRLLVSIAEAIQSKSAHALLPIGNSPSLGFRDLLGNSSGMRLSLCFTGSTDYELVYRCAIKFFPERNSVQIFELDVLQAEHKFLSFHLLDTPKTTGYSTYIRRELGAPDRVDYLEFHGILPYVVDSLGNMANEGQEQLNAIRCSMVKLASRLIWIGPLRHTPQREIALIPCPTKFIQDGSNIVQLMHPSYPLGKEIEQFVSAWYERATNHVLRVDIATSNARDVFSILLAPKPQPHLEVPISEHGAGMAQVLPIVVGCALLSISKIPYCLVFENPELHLHDGVHEKLAELLVNSTQSVEGARVITETHSENMLLTLQLNTITANEHKPDVVVNWVQKDDTGYSTCRSYRFDKDGSLGGLWSKSIFGYSGQLARRIIEARKERKVLPNAN